MDVRAKPVANKSCRVPKVIRFGSDCSGLDSAAFAMGTLNARYVNTFASDVLPEARKILELAHNPEKIWDDMLTREVADEVYVDIYVWTPPCQDVSKAGKEHGLSGGNQSGKLIARSLAFIKRQKPRVTLMEFVPRLLAAKHRPHFAGMLKALKSLGYNVNFKVLNAKDCQVAQQRERLFIVAIRVDSQRYPFRWPPKLPELNGSVCLDKFNSVTDVPGRLPQNNGSKQRVKTAMSKVFQSIGINPCEVPVFIDCDCSAKFLTYGVDEARTITRARGGTGGPWVSSRGRKTNTNELLRLMGFEPSEVPWVAAKLSQRQIGQLLGNSVCPPVIGMVLAEAMYAAGLTTTKLVWPVVWPSREV